MYCLMISFKCPKSCSRLVKNKHLQCYHVLPHIVRSISTNPFVWAGNVPGVQALWKAPVTACAKLWLRDISAFFRQACGHGRQLLSSGTMLLVPQSLFIPETLSHCDLSIMHPHWADTSMFKQCLGLSFRLLALVKLYNKKNKQIKGCS